MTGDFNAHARSQDGPRMNLPVDTGFATMLAKSRMVDTAEVTENVDLSPTHKPRNGETKQGDATGNRLDRVYVNGVALMAAVRASGAGVVPEDKVTETDHGVVWCDIHTGVWESPIPEPIIPFKPRVASHGVTELTHPRLKGVPTRLCNPRGVVATAAETVEWLKAGGYASTDLVVTPALGDGTPWMSGWMKGNRRPGGLATPTWIPKPGESAELVSLASRIGGPKPSGEQWVKWSGLTLGITGKRLAVVGRGDSLTGK